MSAASRSAIFLFGRQPGADRVALAAAELTVLFGLIVLVSGPLWARKAWGVWWQWDARLTSTLVMWLVFQAYLLLRRFGGPGIGEAVGGGGGLRRGARAVRLLVGEHVAHRAPDHQRACRRSMPAMRGPFLWCVAAFLCLFVLLLAARTELENRRRPAGRTVSGSRGLMMLKIRYPSCGDADGAGAWRMTPGMPQTPAAAQPPAPGRLRAGRSAARAGGDAGRAAGGRRLRRRLGGGPHLPVLDPDAGSARVEREMADVSRRRIESVEASDDRRDDVGALHLHPGGPAARDRDRLDPRLPRRARRLRRGAAKRREERASRARKRPSA